MIRRGLTLLEVLASTVLLSLVASACVPFLVESMAVIYPVRKAITHSELGLLADAFMADPASFGKEYPATLTSQEAFEIAGPEASGDVSLPPVTVSRLAPEAIDADHTWLIFTCEGLSVSRWIPLVPEEEAIIKP